MYGILVNGKPVYNGDKVDVGATIVLQVGSGESEYTMPGDSTQDESIDEILQDLYGDYAEGEAGEEEDVYDYE